MKEKKLFSSLVAAHDGKETCGLMQKAGAKKPRIGIKLTKKRKYQH